MDPLDLLTLDKDNIEYLNKNSSQCLDPWTAAPGKHVVFQVLTVMLCLHLPFIVMMNSVIIVAYFYIFTLHTPDNFAIVALAISDLINGIINIPIIVVSNLDENSFRRTEVGCFFRWTPVVFLSGLSLGMLMLLVIDRYLAICRPFWYCRHVSDLEMVKGTIGVVTINVSILLCFTATYSYNVSIKCPLQRCTYLRSFPLWVNVYLTFSVKLLIMLISMFCTVGVAVTLWKKLKKYKQLASQQRSMSESAIEKMTGNAKISIILMFVYIGLLLPSTVLFFLHDEIDHSSEQIIYVIVDHLRFFNCSLNALIYAFTRKIYREAYKYLLTHRPSRWHNVCTVCRDNTIFQSQFVLDLRSLVKNRLIESTKTEKDELQTMSPGTSVEAETIGSSVDPPIQQIETENECRRTITFSMMSSTASSVRTAVSNFLRNRTSCEETIDEQSRSQHSSHLS